VESSCKYWNGRRVNYTSGKKDPSRNRLKLWDCVLGSDRTNVPEGCLKGGKDCPQTDKAV